MLFFSSFLMAYTTFTEKTEPLPVYYVSITGSNYIAVDCPASSTPLATVHTDYKTKPFEYSASSECYIPFI